MGLFYRIDIMLITNRLVNVSAESVTQNAHEWLIK
jgi:hypothetical protein